MEQQILQFFLDALQRVTKLSSGTDVDITQEFEAALYQMESTSVGTKNATALLAAFRAAVTLPAKTSDKDTFRILHKTARATRRHREELQVDQESMKERYGKVLAKILPVSEAEPEPEPEPEAEPEAKPKTRLDFSQVLGD